MKYILLSLLFILGGCSAVGGTVGGTSDYESPLLDPNVLICPAAVSYTHLTLPTNREV